MFVIIIIVVIVYGFIGGLLAFLAVRTDVHSLKYYEHKYVWRTALLWPIGIWVVVPEILERLRIRNRQTKNK